MSNLSLRNISIAIIVSTGLFLVWALFYKLPAIIQEQRNEACIDAGGIPVEILHYTRGYGQGYMCIEITRKIEMAKR